MSPKVWLAVLFGIILGTGVAYLTASPVAPAVANLQGTAEPFATLRQTVTVANPTEPDWQLALVALLVGLVVASPVFLIVNRARNH